MLIIFTFDDDRDRDKFEYLFNRYKKLAMHKAYDILRDYSLAEDASSEAFIRVYKNLSKISDPGSPQTAAFIITIVKNVSITMLRKYKNIEADELDEDIDGGFDLESMTLTKLEADSVYGLLDQLGEEIKGVFLLKYAYDLSHKEIGRILGISENNVTVRLHRAKKKLSVLLVEGGYINE